jgi:hypothetical protein
MRNTDEHFEYCQFPIRSAEYEKFGINFSTGGAHISKTMMLKELEAILLSVPMGSSPINYCEAIVNRNILNKGTESTRLESMRRLRSLYCLDESVPIFYALRKLFLVDQKSLPFLALQVVWARDPFFRSTTAAILNLSSGEEIQTGALSDAFEKAYPGQYSLSSKGTTARNCASTWTQVGYLIGHKKKSRSSVKPTPAAVTMALYIGYSTGFYGLSIFENPWCKLLDLSADRAKSIAQEAHRIGLLNLRAISEVIEVSFPSLEVKMGSL